MTTHISQILNEWRKRPDLQWVLATLVKVEGSSYRKPGAMMLIDGLGHHYGMLSGGCLEADIVLKAGQTLNDGVTRILRYDMSEESELAWRFGLGCGGCIEILLQSINAENQHLYLNELFDLYKKGHSCLYLQSLNVDHSIAQIVTESDQDNTNTSFLTACHYKEIQKDGLNWFVNAIDKQIHIAILGGGIDAVAVHDMASLLSWKITVCDPRQAYARPKNFPNAHNIVKENYDHCVQMSSLEGVDAVIIMHHNVKLDGQALRFAQSTGAKYVGMLGPRHRTQRILDEQKLSKKSLSIPLMNPLV